MSGTNVDRGQDAPRPTTPPPTPATGTVERNVLFIASIAAPLCTMGLEFYTWTRWHSVFPGTPLGDVAGYGALIELPVLLALAILCAYLAIVSIACLAGAIARTGWRWRLLIPSVLCAGTLVPVVWALLT